MMFVLYLVWILWNLFVFELDYKILEVLRINRNNMLVGDYRLGNLEEREWLNFISFFGGEICVLRIRVYVSG